MKFLILIEDELYGYERADLLAIDIAQNKPEKFRLFMKEKDQFKVIYSEISMNNLEKLY